MVKQQDAQQELDESGHESIVDLLIQAMGDGLEIVLHFMGDKVGSGCFFGGCNLVFLDACIWLIVEPPYWLWRCGDA